jgi:hypothetical protein
MTNENRVFKNKKIKLPPSQIRCKISAINEWTGKNDDQLNSIHK